MRVYKTAEIRNVAVAGHGASGKTSLVDALSFVAGTSKRHGAVKDGTALTDYTADEIERKYSINLAIGVAEWMETKINLIDTPGYLDFTGDALAGIHAADGAVVVVSGTGGVEVGTEKAWDYCESRGLSRLFFVSLMDKEHADFERVYNQVKERLTPKVIPVEIPVGEGPQFHGIINLFSRKCHLYKKGTKTGEYEEVEVPAEYQDRLDRYSKDLMERIAETDDTLLERYLGGQEIGARRGDRCDEGGNGPGRDLSAVLRGLGAHVRDAGAALEDGRAAPGAPRAPADRGAEVGKRGQSHPQVGGRRTVRGSGLQDYLGASCGRRQLFPDRLRHGEEWAGCVECAARGGREVEPPVRGAREGTLGNR